MAKNNRTTVAVAETDDELMLELVPRNCKLQRYTKQTVKPLTVDGEIIAYASPDSTFAVTKRLFDEARKSILIGIYDFTADYMKELLLHAMERGVKVSLMLDIDSKEEQALFDDLAEHGARCVPAPSCASKIIHYFRSSHEKVIIIDGEWALVQSGNYSVNSIPFNEQEAGGSHFRTGNRDTGLAVQSKELASLLTKILLGDMKLETDAEGEEAVAVAEEAPSTEILERVVVRRPPELFPSKAFTPPAAVRVTPVLTPDNYMDVIPRFLESAKRSIFIEEQYIKWAQPAVAKLLAAIQKAVAKSPGLDVRVILARPLSRGAKFAKDVKEIEGLSKFGLKMGSHVRILNPQHFVHCHNKLIIVDNNSVLVSSQNWSDAAVTENREAGLLVEYPAVARYFAAIFESDWEHGLTELDVEALEPELLPASQLNGNAGVYRLSRGDYTEV